MTNLSVINVLNRIAQKFSHRQMSGKYDDLNRLENLILCTNHRHPHMIIMCSNVQLLKVQWG